jgi:hypothetical protein
LGKIIKISTFWAAFGQKQNSFREFIQNIEKSPTLDPSWPPLLYSPFCVTAKVIKLVGLKNGGRVSPTNLISFAGTQNGEYKL